MLASRWTDEQHNETIRRWGYTLWEDLRIVGILKNPLPLEDARRLHGDAALVYTLIAQFRDAYVERVNLWGSRRITASDDFVQAFLTFVREQSTLRDVVLIDAFRRAHEEPWPSPELAEQIERRKRSS